MIKNLKIMAVVPAYNVEDWIEYTILSMPKFVDLIVVVDDNSLDNTENIVKKFKNRVKYIKHNENLGVGASIETGYKYGIKNGFDLITVMAGDAQMDPDQLYDMCLYMLNNNIDYIKGNRYKDFNNFTFIPSLRIIGSLSLSFINKFVTGYYHIGDSQSGYTIIKKDILKKLLPLSIYRGYGYPNDILAKLKHINGVVEDFPIKAVYNGQKSGINPIRSIIPYSKLLYKIWYDRVIKKYS